LEKEIRKLKASLPIPNNPDVNKLLPDGDSVHNYNYHIKRLNEEFDDALQHLKLALVIARRRDE
jgi:hypothetical protein